MLKVEGIEVFYGKIQALFGVSIEVKEGEIVAIIGANGAGKTTTLRTITGLQKPVKGSITFEGQQINGKDTDWIAKRGISMVPEGRQVFPYFTVRENLLAGACGRRQMGATAKEVEKDIQSMYELFPRLKERMSQKAWSLSGGEQQMLALARGLLGRPKLLMLDEPSLGLAPVIVQDVFKTIKTINEQGTTILLVEQNANLALSLADRGYVLEGGKVTVTGTGANLRGNDKVEEAYLGG